MLVSKIQSERGDHKSSDIVELNLNGCDATNFDGLSDEYESLKHLNLSNNAFKTLKGFPQLKSLGHLDLSNNNIDGGLNALANCGQLQTLDLSGNQISEIAQLEPLKSCAALEVLKLAGCPLSASASYIAEVFNLLPQLKSIDGHDRNEIHATNGNGSHQLNGSGVEEEDEEEDDEDESGLEQLQKDDLEDDDEEYAPEGEDDDEDDEDDDEDIDEDEEDDGEGDESSEGVQTRGVKRKHDDEEVDPEDNSNSAQ